MSNLPAINQSEVTAFVKDQIMAGASDAELQAFLMVARATGLDPMRRQVFAVKRAVRQRDGSYRDQWSTQCSIDGFRAIAESSGDYEGQAGPFWCGADGVWKDVWISNVPPMASRVGVWRKGFRDPLYRVATWAEYCQKGKDGKPTKFWAAMPSLMLAKCAEALALRAAFPQKLSGVYTADEMPQEVESEVVQDEPKIIQQPRPHVQHKPQPQAPQSVQEAPKVDTAPVLDKLIQRAMEGGPIGARNYAEAIGWQKDQPYPNCMTFVIPIGKNKGRSLLDVPGKDMLSLAEYLIGEFRSGKPLSQSAIETIGAIQDYIDSRREEIPPPPSEHDMPKFSDDEPMTLQI